MIIKLKEINENFFKATYIEGNIKKEIRIRKNIINGYIVGYILELDGVKNTITLCTVIKTSKTFFKPMNRFVFSFKTLTINAYQNILSNELFSFILQNGEIIDIRHIDDFQKWEQKPTNAFDILEAYTFHDDIMTLTSHFNNEFNNPSKKERTYLKKLYNQLEEESSAQINDTPTSKRAENIIRVRKLADKLLKS